MSEATRAPGALAGKRVIDLTRVLGGPYCTQILGDHGAEIIKIEPPQGDEVRDWGPPFHEGDASYFIGLNRNKRSLGLDLSKPEGRDVLMRLLENADALIENYKPGTMERWGIGYEDVLSQRFPELVHCRISGYGGDGPLGGYPGYDAIIQGTAGWFSVNGTPDTGPTRVGIPMVDMGTGLYAAIAILMAIIERGSSGRGQYIDMTLFDSAVALMHPYLINYLLSDTVPTATGNAHPNVSPYDKFRTKTVDIFFGCGNDRAFGKLCTVLGRPDLPEDPRFNSNGGRVTNREALTGELESVLVKLDGEAICEKLLKAGVPAGPVLDTAQMYHHEHTKYREMAVSKDWYKMSGIPIKLSRTPGSIRSLPPKFGEHGRDILAEAGYEAGEIDALVEGGTVLEQRRS
ncbi:MAG: CoA transferase [Alphaproteobacteria bacterium]|nr:CoA transferase [Alphaproteobacteria bacterium]